MRLSRIEAPAFDAVIGFNGTISETTEVALRQPIGFRPSHSICFKVGSSNPGPITFETFKNYGREGLLTELDYPIPLDIGLVRENLSLAFVRESYFRALLDLEHQKAVPIIIDYMSDADPLKMQGGFMLASQGRDAYVWVDTYDSQKQQLSEWSVSFRGAFDRKMEEVARTRNEQEDSSASLLVLEELAKRAVAGAYGKEDLFESYARREAVRVEQHGEQRLRASWERTFLQSFIPGVSYEELRKKVADIRGV